MLPKIDYYANRDAVKLTTEHLELWYSYHTIVAFRTKVEGLVCCENVWSSSTGRHLNLIEPEKEKRVAYKLFQALLKAIVTIHIVEQ